MIHSDGLAAMPCLLISNKRRAAALEYAELLSVPAAIIPTVGREEAADDELLIQLQKAGADLVILSGYLRKLGRKTLNAFEGRILNVHPALLPKFGGKGMYGRRVHEAVHDAGERVTGATIHLVDGEYDHGRVIGQRSVEIANSETVEQIEQKVIEAEGVLFSETIRRLCRLDLILPL